LLHVLYSIFIYFIGVIVICGLFSMASGYRNYSTGHYFIRAFQAKSPFQRMFTKLQSEKDINRCDIGKITYVGYGAIIIASITLCTITPFCIGTYFVDRYLASKIYGFWFAGSSVLGMGVFLVQLIDSLLNILIKYLKKIL
jgi:hypothetical protein